MRLVTAYTKGFTTAEAQANTEASTCREGTATCGNKNNKTVVTALNIYRIMIKRKQ